jgi:hypothetical protein
MFLMVVAGPKRPLGCGSTSIFGTAGYQLQQDLLRLQVGVSMLETPERVLGCLAGSKRISMLQRNATLLQCGAGKHGSHIWVSSHRDTQQRARFVRLREP